MGKAITMMLAQAGADVIVNYYSSSTAADADGSRSASTRCVRAAIQCDVADWTQVRAMAMTIIDEFGGVDIIVNSASLFEKTPFPTDDISAWQRVTGISIDGPFYVCNALCPRCWHAAVARLSILSTSLPGSLGPILPHMV